MEEPVEAELLHRRDRVSKPGLCTGRPASHAEFAHEHANTVALREVGSVRHGIAQPGRIPPAREAAGEHLQASRVYELALRIGPFFADSLMGVLVGRVVVEAVDHARVVQHLEVIESVGPAPWTRLDHQPHVRVLGAHCGHRLR